MNETLKPDVVKDAAGSAIRLLDRQIESLESALCELRKARREALDHYTAANAVRPSSARAAYGSVKRAVLDVLRTSKTPLSVADVLEGVNKEFLSTDRSVRNCLWRLVESGEADHLDGRFTLGSA